MDPSFFRSCFTPVHDRRSRLEPLALQPGLEPVDVHISRVAGLRIASALRSDPMGRGPDNSAFATSPDSFELAETDTPFPERLRKEKLNLESVFRSRTGSLDSRESVSRHHPLDKYRDRSSRSA